MKHILILASLFFGFSFCVFAEASVEKLLDQLDRLYCSDSSHTPMYVQIDNENWERTTIIELWS